MGISITGRKEAVFIHAKQLGHKTKVAMGRAINIFKP
jgi:hypothetical protein